MALQHHTQIFTRFTDPNAGSGSEKTLVYSADKWVRVKLILQTAGAVIVGTAAELNPTAPGQGALLTQNVPFTFTLPKGDRLYMVSQALNRVVVVIEPFPWLEEITALLCAGK